MVNFERINPNLKKEINKEGWEGDKEGGAAVFIGTKEEVEKAREKMESEGRAADLATYIRLHREIVLPKDEIEEKDKDVLGSHVGSSIVEWIGRGNVFILRFIDKDQNIVKVEIDMDKIDEFKEAVKKGEMVDIPLNNKLNNELGFSYGHSDPNISYFWQSVGTLEGEYRKKLEAEAKKETKKEFDF